MNASIFLPVSYTNLHSKFRHLPQYASRCRERCVQLCVLRRKNPAGKRAMKQGLFCAEDCRRTLTGGEPDAKRLPIWRKREPDAKRLPDWRKGEPHARRRSIWRKGEPDAKRLPAWRKGEPDAKRRPAWRKRGPGAKNFPAGVQDFDGEAGDVQKAGYGDKRTQIPVFTPRCPGGRRRRR